MRVPQTHRHIIVRLRTHLNSRVDCQCVRCQAADEISRLRIELWEAYEQIAILLMGDSRQAEENDPELWAELPDDFSQMIRNSDISTD